MIATPHLGTDMMHLSTLLMSTKQMCDEVAKNETKCHMR